MKLLIELIGAILLLATFASANPEAIWTTNGDCGTQQQDVNNFAAGDHVFINGKGFSSASEAWDITGLPGGASCDPAQIVASDNIPIGINSGFCFDAYTIQDDDSGEYKATVGNKHDNFRVDTNEIPEFGIAAASIALAGAIAGFFFLRKK